MQTDGCRARSTSFPGSLSSASLDRWGEGPWLWLVMWPPSIWVVKKSVGWKLWEGVLIVAVTNFVGFKTSSSRQQLPALSSIKVEFCWWTMLHLFCHLPNIEDFHTKKFGNQMERKLFNVFLALVKCHILNWSETSGSDSWISEFGGNLFSSLCSILDVKKYFCHTAD